MEKLFLIIGAAILLQAVGSFALFAIPKDVREWIKRIRLEPSTDHFSVLLLYGMLVGAVQFVRTRSDRRVLMEFVGKKRRMDEAEFVATLRKVRLPKNAAHFCRLARNGLSINFSDDTAVNLL